MTPYIVNVNQVARVAEHLRQAAEQGKAIFPDVPISHFLHGFLFALTIRLLESGETAGELQFKTAEEAAEEYVRSIVEETNRRELN